MSECKPRVFASRCLGFATVRWNGITIQDAFIDKLGKYVDYVHTCPEVKIGLGVPRNPIRVVQSWSGLKLYQPASGKDVSKEMEDFSSGFLDGLGTVDGFILKAKSPSCGTSKVKVYKEEKGGVHSMNGMGFFGRAVKEAYPGKPLEDEERLRNYWIRDNFLSRVFLLARLREVEDKGKMSGLVDFQARNKFLVNQFSQAGQMDLGRLVANKEGLGWADLIRSYRTRLEEAVKRDPGKGSKMNIMMHAFGFFSKKVKSQEKRHFLDLLEKYKAGKVTASVPNSILYSWALRFDEEYIENQTFFRPYPEEMDEIEGPCRIRDKAS